MKKNANIPARYLQILDKYLLLNHPLLWASGLHKLIFNLTWVTAINLLLAYFLPVGIEAFHDIDAFLLYFSILGALSFLLWGIFQSLMSYRKSNGITGRFFFFKMFSIFYVAVLLIIISEFIPFNILRQRCIKTLIDPKIPALQVKPFRDRISYHKIYLDTTQSFYDKSFEKAFDSLSNFASEHSDAQHSFRTTSREKLSDLQMAVKILQNVGMGVSSYSIDEKRHIIKAKMGYVNKKTSKPAGFFLIYYKNFKESIIVPELYKRDVILRKITLKDSLGNEMPPFTFYYYHAPNPSIYKYASSNTIQADLLADSLLSTDQADRSIERLNRLDKQLENIQSSTEVSYIAPVFVLLGCLMLFLVLFMVTYSTDLSAILTTFVVLIPTVVIVTFFKEKFSTTNLPVWLLLLLIIMAMGISYFLTSTNFRNFRKNTCILVLAYFSMASCVALFCKFEPGILDMDINLRAVPSMAIITDISAIVLGLYIIPCFYASRIEKLSYLPLESIS